MLAQSSALTRPMRHQHHLTSPTRSDLLTIHLSRAIIAPFHSLVQPSDLMMAHESHCHSTRIIPLTVAAFLTSPNQSRSLDVPQHSRTCQQESSPRLPGLRLSHPLALALPCPPLPMLLPRVLLILRIQPLLLGSTNPCRSIQPVPPQMHLLMQMCPASSQMPAPSKARQARHSHHLPRKPASGWTMMSQHPQPAPTICDVPQHHPVKQNHRSLDRESRPRPFHHLYHNPRTDATGMNATRQLHRASVQQLRAAHASLLPLPPWHAQTPPALRLAHSRHRIALCPSYLRPPASNPRLHPQCTGQKLQSMAVCLAVVFVRTPQTCAMRCSGCLVGAIIAAVSVIYGVSTPRPCAGPSPKLPATFLQLAARTRRPWSTSVSSSLQAVTAPITLTTCTSLTQCR